MREQTDGLPPLARAIVAQEQALLERVHAALRSAAEQAQKKARSHRSDLRSVEVLKQLREDARTGSEDDLPALLLEMSVRQRLLEKPAEPALPDPLSPYIAHLQLNEGGARKDYLLGHTSFFDTPAGVRIVDWRLAPVAQIFYRYREGDDYEETFPGRTAEGVLEARRIVVISNGVIQQIIGDGMVLTRQPDGTFRVVDEGQYALDPGGAGTAPRAGILGVGVGADHRRGAPDVTALLDADQYAAITTPPETPVLVLGSAGSGKTTVALHRLSRIAAQTPARYPLSRMKVVVPEEGLARLSRRLLAPLGAGDTQVQTLDAWAQELASEVFDEPLPSLCTDPPALVSSLKRHPAFYHAVRQRFAQLKPAHTSLKSLRRRLGELLTDRPFLTSVVEASQGTLSRVAVQDTVAHTLLQLADPPKKQLASIVVASRTKTADGRPVWEGTPDELAGTIDADDLPVLLMLRARHCGIETSKLVHLVLDEAEDFSLFDLFVLGKLLEDTPSVTLAGDEAQQTLSSFAGWKASLATLGTGEASICRLATSYRCPEPVADLARSILGNQVPEATARSSRQGVPVGIFRFPEENQAHLLLAGAVRDLSGREPRACIAVICHDPDTARQIHALWADIPQARLVLSGEFSFEPGIDVTDVDNVKGLEFDYVIVPDASAEAYPDTAEARRRLHVAVTRTSHQLWVMSHGSPSALLATAGDALERPTGISPTDVLV
jgi:DNA helicase IV